MTKSVFKISPFEIVFLIEDVKLMVSYIMHLLLNWLSF
jgi:hypothetical protein